MKKKNNNDTKYHVGDIVYYVRVLGEFFVTIEPMRILDVRIEPVATLYKIISACGAQPSFGLTEDELISTKAEAIKLASKKLDELESKIDRAIGPQS